MPINLKELAKICQVDISTISRALRDDERVKVSTRAHIKKLAKEHGYLPNLAARNLATGKTNQVALLVNGLSTSLEMEIAKNLSILLLEKDIDLVLLQHFDKPKIYIRQLQRLRKNQFDAAIIIPGSHDVTSNIINQYTPLDIPALLIDRYPENATIPIITTNNLDASYQICSHFSKHKIEAILPLFGSYNDVEKQRLAGAIKLAKEHKIKILTEKDLEKPLPFKKIGILGSTAKRLQTVYEQHLNSLAIDVFAGCFDYWSIDTTPFASVEICIQDFNKITQTAVDIIFNNMPTNNTITQINHKEIVTIKNYTP